MNLLVTGSTGFLGKLLIDKLFSQYENQNVFPVIRKNATIFNGHNTVVVNDINSTTDWTDKLQKINVVIHCAARVHIMNDTSSNPLDKFREVNTFGTLHLAQQAADVGVKRFIFISSIKVNGEATELNTPFSADDEMTPEDPYGVSKAEAEIGLQKIAEETGMEVVFIRPPLVYGPGVKANFAAIIKLASFGIPLPFGGINKNKRSMVYVGNLVDLIITCIAHPNAANQTFLVSDDDDLSTARMIKELSLALGNIGWMLPVPVKLFEWLGKITGKSAMVERLCGSLQVDISKTKQLLDWQPPFSVKEGFAETAKHFLQNK